MTDDRKSRTNGQAGFVAVLNDASQAPKLRTWIDERGGVAVWVNHDLSSHDVGGEAYTPATTGDGKPMGTPHWRFGKEPMAVVTDASKIGVAIDDIVEVFRGATTPRGDLRAASRRKAEDRVTEARAKHPDAIECFYIVTDGDLIAIVVVKDIVPLAWCTPCFACNGKRSIPEFVAHGMFYCETCDGERVQIARPQCHHIFRHAITVAERRRAIAALEYARTIGDSQGITVSLAALAPCSAAAPAAAPTDRLFRVEASVLFPGEIGDNLPRHQIEARAADATAARKVVEEALLAELAVPGKRQEGSGVLVHGVVEVDETLTAAVEDVKARRAQVAPSGGRRGKGR